MGDARREVVPMLVLSTAHLTRDTVEEIRARSERGYPDDDYELPVIYEKEEYGYFIPVPEARIMPATCPPDLLAIIDLARRNGCGYVMLDRDADEIEGLPVHEW